MKLQFYSWVGFYKPYYIHHVYVLSQTNRSDVRSNYIGFEKKLEWWASDNQYAPAKKR